MRASLLLPCAALLGVALLASVAAPRAHQDSRGALIVVGGGGTPDDVLIEGLALTGAESPRVVIVPQASSKEDRGKSSLKMFQDLGVEHVELLDPLSQPGTQEKLEAADLIWFSGGSQRDLIKRLAAEKFASLIPRLHSSGTAIGGTSAGAAVMGAVMVSGDPETQEYLRGGYTHYRGLGLWPIAIVDQHFVERSREGRLFTAVLDKPRMLGVGIGERTAAIVTGDEMRVVGEGTVMIVDARSAEVERSDKGARQRARGLTVHLLAAGDEYTWFE